MQEIEMILTGPLAVLVRFRRVERSETSLSSRCPQVLARRLSVLLGRGGDLKHNLKHDPPKRKQGSKYLLRRRLDVFGCQAGSARRVQILEEL